MKKRTRRNIFAQISSLRSLFYRNYYEKSKMNLEKQKEVYVHKISIYKNLSHFSNSYYGFGILNNVGKHFLQKIPFKSSFCREACGQ